MPALDQHEGRKGAGAVPQQVGHRQNAARGGGQADRVQSRGGHRPTAHRRDQQLQAAAGPPGGRSARV